MLVRAVSLKQSKPDGWRGDVFDALCNTAWRALCNQDLHGPGSVDEVSRMLDALCEGVAYVERTVTILGEDDERRLTNCKLIADAFRANKGSKL
jgi:hypothetical protein